MPPPCLNVIIALTIRLALLFALVPSSTAEGTTEQLGLPIAEPPASNDTRAGQRHPSPPKWPDTYTVKFKFYVPFLSKYQNGPLKYDMQFFRDSKRGLQKVVRSNVETWIEHAAEDKRWYVQPGNSSALGCLCEQMSAGGGPSRRLQHSQHDKYYDLLSPALPIIEAPRWTFGGTQRIEHGGRHTHAHLWHYRLVHDKGYGRVPVDWRLYVSGEGTPLRLDMHGINWFSGGHWDHYIAEFYDFEAQPEFEEGLFDVPALCNDAPSPPSDLTPLLGGHHLSARLHRSMHGLMPGRHGSDAEYDAHAHASGRWHAHAAEYHTRRAQYHASKRAIAEHNGQTKRTYDQALNHFADWSAEEWRALVHSGRKAAAERTIAPSTHTPTWPLHMLPGTVDWRGTEADSTIKDQAMCGSCWSFATVSPIETAYYAQYGELRLMSEQYLMDCSWPFGNTGCNGGYQETAFAFILANGGIAANADYAYHGVNMACRNDTPLAAALEGFVSVPPYNKTLLQEALLTRGPMAVSINADDPGFKFYRSGIFYSKNCTTGPPSELDHAVMISGYGRDAASGRRFWIIKNIWSTFWGEGGYMRIDMDRNDCGVSAAAEYVSLDVPRTDALRASGGALA